MVLPSLNLPNRSRLRLTLDLIVGIPLLLMLWGLDEVRVRLERITSRIYRDAAANRHGSAGRHRKVATSVKESLAKRSNVREPADIARLRFGTSERCTATRLIDPSARRSEGE